MCVIRVPVELTGIPSTSHYISFLFIFVDFSDVVKPIIIIIIINNQVVRRIKIAVENDVKNWAYISLR